MAEHYFTPAPESAHEERTFAFDFAGRTLSFTTDAGVFSKGRVDPGSLLLCRALPAGLSGRVLDMGCGWGAMTAMILCRFPATQVTMADVNARALALARRSRAANSMRAEAVLSDGFREIAGFFDAVVTNPPIRAGKQVVYGIFSGALAHLAPGGALYTVVRKQQGAPSALAFLRETFGAAEVIERDAGYWVIRTAQGGGE